MRTLSDKATDSLYSLNYEYLGENFLYTPISADDVRFNGFWPSITYLDLDNLNNEDKIDFFYKYKNKDDELGIGLVEKTSIYFHNLLQIQNGAFQFFYQMYAQDPIFPGNYKDINVIENVVENTEKYRIGSVLELYVKISNLSYDFLQNKHFNFFPNLHFNPSINKWIVHPGSGRQVVYYLFDDNSYIEGIVFNTKNKAENFKIQTKLNSKYDFINKLNIDLQHDVIGISAKYGSLFPEIHYRRKSFKDNILLQYDRMFNFLDTHNITSNFGFTHLSKNYNNSRKPTDIHIRLKHPEDVLDHIRSILLVPFCTKHNIHKIYKNSSISFLVS